MDRSTRLATVDRRQGSWRRALVIVSCGALAAAFGGCAEGPSSAGQAAAARRTLQVANTPAFGKPTAEVDVQYSVPAETAAGVGAEIAFELVPRSPTDRVDAHFTGIDGLVVERGGELPSVANPELGTPIAHVVTVRAGADGAYAIAVLITTRTGEATLARAVSIPVTIGRAVAGTRKSAAPVAVDATGERIESMPAEETVVR